MSKGKSVYDIFTIIYLLLIGGTLLFFGSSSAFEMPVLILLIIPSYFYTVAIVLLADKKAKTKVDKFVILIGSLIMPGVLPLFFYIFTLRKRL
jgi:hypothetical protein